MKYQVNQVKNGEKFIADKPREKMHDLALWQTRKRRDKCAQAIPEWEQLRGLASEIKKHTLTHLADYLEKFEAKLIENGIHVHWADTPDDQNRIIGEIVESHNVKVITKSKSMTQDECGTQAFLRQKGIEVNEADLGCRIQQLDNEPDSHIVMPSIHQTCGDVARIFARTLGSDPYRTSPHYLNSVMRADMRKRYIKADCGMGGCNYALADTGTLTICTNEGDADISVTVPDLYISTIGIDKVIPSARELGVFIRLLTRSSIGYAITQYTTNVTKPRPGQEFHVVILNNGRTERLANDAYWEVLKCIRCATCMNTCPVFRRTGGLSYEAVYMGPLGLVLMPSYDLYKYARLPYSCTHCGSCGDVCPVKIPIPELIFYWRSVVCDQKDDLFEHREMMGVMKDVLESSKNLSKAEKLGLMALRMIPKDIAQNPHLNPWAKEHTDPLPPKQTFRQYYKEHLAKKGDDLTTEKTRAVFAAAKPAPEAKSEFSEPTSEVPKHDDDANANANAKKQ